MTRIEKDKWYICHTQFGLCDVGFKVKYSDYINKNGLRFVDENGMYYSITFDEIEKYFKPIEVKENNMTIEEKAKAYDEAVKKVKDYYEGKTKMYSDIEQTLDLLFPEIKESEDEKIRKGIIELVKQSSEILDKKNQERMLAWLEKQGEQKPIDKIEPKFHKGDWAISNLDGKARQISEVHFDEYNSYYVVDGKSVNLEEYDRLHHLWTIQDAKDGDVLAEDSCIFIIKKLGDNSTAAKTYCTLYNDGDFDDGSILYFDIDSTKPSTKEQRDLLFQKMKEAGYMWDEEKKELRKIEKQGETALEAIHIVSNPQVVCPYCKNTNCAYVDGHWFCLDCHREFQKPKWSEEDEDNLNMAIYFMRSENTPYSSTDVEPVVEWLCGLKQRMEEQQ